MGVIDFKGLLRHEGHNLACVTYGDPPMNVAVECETCCEVLFDFDSEEISEHDPDACGCKYLGSDMWSCGHCDNDAMGE
jgi:hypothetical protein